eukprot:CAMPEP_0171044940 /NCGR_PEP_ID=MMETSP0736-20130129/48228_1 /TAXON_ID=186038 /ORGANISM="Fragilariopsis kerguelensis, Strain L26-C5" /LENGTH=47 /DNA_ID= /DNA_START= /DNA_END= /DNA_ORIENTATION=
MNMNSMNMHNVVFSPVPLSSASDSCGQQQEIRKKQPLMITSTDLQQL